jgi:hypothetical protein
MQDCASTPRNVEGRHPAKLALERHGPWRDHPSIAKLKKAKMCQTASKNLVKRPKMNKL